MIEFPVPQLVKRELFPNSKVERVTFFGFADAHEGDPLYQIVYDTAQLVAKAGYTVVDGGGPGVMAAASQGAKSVGGKTIGVTFYPKDAANFEGQYKGNVMDEEIVTQNYIERTLRLMEYGQVYLVFKGGTGTISEFGMSWGMARLYFGHHKPFILVGEGWDEIIEVFAKHMKIRDEELRVFTIAYTPEQVLQELLEFDEEISHDRPEYHAVSPNEQPFVI